MTPTNKPYQGEIHEWERKYFDREETFSNSLGYKIYGIPKNHPFYINWILTSAVVDYDETTGIVETLNSTYKLVPPRRTTSPKK
jgi:hypothetical protein